MEVGYRFITQRGMLPHTVEAVNAVGLGLRFAQRRQQQRCKDADDRDDRRLSVPFILFLWECMRRGNRKFLRFKRGVWNREAYLFHFKYHRLTQVKAICDLFWSQSHGYRAQVLRGRLLGKTLRECHSTIDV